MPGWTIIETGYEGQKWSVFVQHAKAINERLHLCWQWTGEGGWWQDVEDVAVPGVDDVTGDAATIVELQEAVHAACVNFIDRSVFPGPTYDGMHEDDFVWLWYTIATFKTDTGLTGDGPSDGMWRRIPTWTAPDLSYDEPTDKTTVTATFWHPFKAAHVGKNIEFSDANRGKFEITDYVSVSVVKVSGDCTGGTGSVFFSILPSDFDDYDDAAWWYGPAQTNDVLGKHLFVDLQLALNHMTWVCGSTGGIPNIRPVSAKCLVKDTDFGYGASIADAKADAWAHLEYEGESGWYGGRIHEYAWWDAPETRFGYAGYRGQGVFYFTTASDQEKDIDWYINLHKNGDEYFPDGDDGGEGEEHFYHFDDTVTSDQSPESQVHGSTNVPSGVPTQDVSRGYLTYELLVVVKMDHIGGFEYYLKFAEYPGGNDEDSLGYWRFGERQGLESE